MLKIRDGMLQGTLNGMLVNCALRPGVSISRGAYKLLPAVQDPVFGTLVAMVPAGVQFNQQPSPPSVFKFDAATGFATKDRGGVPTVPGFTYDKVTSGERSGQGFVLSARAMPGTSNIVVNSGFSGLVEGLSKGETMVEVA